MRLEGMTREGWTRLTSRMDGLLERVEIAKKGDRYHYLVGYETTENPAFVEVDGERMLMMSSYSYLGLNGDPRISAAAREAIDEYGTATHGVRLLAGSLPIHRELEKTIARLKGVPDAIVYASGYAANVGTIAALCGPRDRVFVDMVDHASIIDGCRLSGARYRMFRHNNPDDLDQKLRQMDSPVGFRLVVVDGVYSMSGDIAPLPELREVCDQHGALLMVDEAHSMGMIGSRGLGVDDHFEREDLVDIRMGTLSKAIPSVGGYVAGPARLVEFLKHASRPFIFSAALPPAQTAAALSALRILEEEPWRARHTQEMALQLRTRLRDAGLDIGRTATAIIPLMTGSDQRAFDLSTACRREAVVALPVVAPAVRPGRARLRVTVTAAHQEEDVELAAKVFIAAARRSHLVAP
jgi:8-amino-7-oxononanoate synthase